MHQTFSTLLGSLVEFIRGLVVSAVSGFKENLNKESIMVILFDPRRLLLVSISLLLSHSVTAQGEVEL